MTDNMGNIGIVVIGRNEGERLKCCLKSVQQQTKIIVYVDSASSDNSVEYAKFQDIGVVQLDMSIPFSAGRARNEGFLYLVNQHPQIQYIQFIDGDCELVANWLNVAQSYLNNHADYAIVTGQRCERYPGKTVYNRLCDIEWDTPIGTAQACGGDFLIRVSAFQQATGFNPQVIAGEEPELCYRLREHGWQIYRFDKKMTLHDANINHFAQWWKRNIRCGHAYAQGYALHGNSGEKYCARDTFRIWLWTIIIPTCIFTLSLALTPTLLFLFAIYPLQFIKIAVTINKRLNNWHYSIPYALFNMISKWPELWGQLIFIRKTIFKKKHVIIEYK